MTLAFLGTDVLVRTHAINNDRSAPVWNATVELPFPEPGTPLRVSIMDSDAAAKDRMQHSEHDDMLATGLVDVRPQMSAVEGWDAASWTSALVGDEEVSQMRPAGPEDAGATLLTVLTLFSHVSHFGLTFHTFFAAQG